VTAGSSIDSWDLNLDRFLYSPESRQQRVLPALRLDYNATRSHRLTASARYNWSWSAPDVLSDAEPRFPAFASHGGHFSDTYKGQVTLRSTLGRASVNEARLGFSGANARSFPEVSASQFDCATLGARAQAGRAGISTSACRSAPTRSRRPPRPRRQETTDRRPSSARHAHVAQGASQRERRGLVPAGRGGPVEHAGRGGPHRDVRRLRGGFPPTRCSPRRPATSRAASVTPTPAARGTSTPC